MRISLPISLEIPLALGALPVFCALLQLLLARHRDLAALTVGVAGCVVVGTDGSEEAWLGAALALGISALASMRGVRVGVGRPALLAGALGAVALGLAMQRWGSLIWPQLLGDPLRGIAMIPCLLAAGVGTLLAWERPGLRRPPTRWRGRVEIHEGPPT